MNLFSRVTEFPDEMQSKTTTTFQCDKDISYTKEPLPLIQSSANGKLVVNSRARSMLARIEKPLVVISIAGLYRTGTPSG